jgi:hypothetical protein
MLALFGSQSWPTPLIRWPPSACRWPCAPPRRAGTLGAEGFGQALLHVLAVTQVGVASVLLTLPDSVMAALIALAFYAWTGAVDALRGGATGRSVAVEFGSLMLLGLIVGMVLHRP